MNILISLLLLNMNNFNYSTKNIYYGHSLFSIWHVFYDSSRETTIIEVGGAYYGFIDELQKTTSKGDTIAFSRNGYLVCKNDKLFYTNKHLKTTFKLKEYNRTEKKEQLRRKIFSDYFGQFIKENKNTKIEHMTYIEFRNNMNIPTNCIEYLKNYYNNQLNFHKDKVIHMQSNKRTLNIPEFRLLEQLIKTATIAVPPNWHDELLVTPMNDDGMGGLTLYPKGVNEVPKRFMGACISEIMFKDKDGIEVIVSLNTDNNGNLYELDIWKTDFSPLIELPTKFE